MARVKAFIQEEDFCPMLRAAADRSDAPVAIYELHYALALSVVNGIFSLEAVGCTREHLQELFEKNSGGKKDQVSDRVIIVCDDNNEESVKFLGLLDATKKILPCASVEHAEECAHCLMGVVSMDGTFRQRFVPTHVALHTSGDEIELMKENDTYDAISRSVHKKVGTVVDFIHCDGDEFDVADGALVPPKGAVPVLRLSYVLALAVVNGFDNVHCLGCEPQRKELQKLYEEKCGAGTSMPISHWFFILVSEYSESEEAMTRLNREIEGLKHHKLGLPFASRGHALRCSNCLLGAVTVNGDFRLRFVPRRFEEYASGKIELMAEDETYDGKPHPANEKPFPKANELLRFCREVGVKTTFGVLERPYPAAIALVSGKASILNIFGEESEVKKSLLQRTRGTAAAKLPVASWSLVVSEAIGKSLTKEQLELVCEFFKLTHGMMSLTIAEAEAFADCVVGAVHSDGRQFRKFRRPQPLSEANDFGRVMSL